MVVVSYPFYLFNREPVKPVPIETSEKIEMIISFLEDVEKSRKQIIKNIWTSKLSFIKKIYLRIVFIKDSRKIRKYVKKHRFILMGNLWLCDEFKDLKKYSKIQMKNQFDQILFKLKNKWKSS